MEQKKNKKISLTNMFQLVGLTKPPSSNEEDTIKVVNTRSIDPSEQKRLIESIHNPTKYGRIDPEAIISYLSPIQEKIEERKLDAEQIKELMPEIAQAETIMIPSILSPNDLQESNLTFSVSHKDLTEEAAGKIAELLYDHFNEQYDINSKAAEWLEDPLYGSGATPVMIIPPIALKDLMDRELSLSGTENLKLSSSKLNDKLDSIWNKNLYSENTLVVSTESLSLEDDILSDIKNHTSEMTINDGKKNKFDTDKFISGIERTITKKFTETNLVSFHEDPSVIGLCSLKRENTKANISSKLYNEFKTFEDMKYRPENVLSIPFDNKGENSIANPSLLVLPNESVIPIHIPGNPKEHLGYFIMLDKQGNPITSEKTTREDSHDNILQSSYSTMFGNTQDLRQMTNMYKNNHSKVVNQVYEGILDNYLTKQLENIGFDDIEISKNDAIVANMLKRFLENKGTRILFVPKELLTYICFKYNADGTGKSRLEGIKFIISLRITLMISRVMAAMEEAIDKHRITLNFDEKVSNPLAILSKIRNRFMETKKMNISYHPNTIMKSLSDKSLMVVPKSIPGLTDFDIDSEKTSSSAQRPDDELSEDLKNITNLGLGVPPTALNNLSEDEYSRSLATTNLFFSNSIRGLQKIFCRFLTEIVSSYSKFSRPIRDSIITIIKESVNFEESEESEESEDSTEMDLKVQYLVDDIINSISISLPKPNIAPDKAQYQELREYKDIIEELLNSLYPQELLEKDRDAAEGLTQLRAYTKSKIMRQYLHTSGFGTSLDIPELDKTMDASTDINQIYQTILNFHKGFDTLAAKLKGEDDSGGGY